MPRELVTVQVGQCGNQLGCRLLDLYMHEHLSALTSASSSTPGTGAARRNIPTTNAQQQQRAAAATPLDPTAMDSLQTVFSLYSRSAPTTVEEVKAAMCARTVAIDMEEGVLKAMLRGPLRDVLRSCHMISDVSGAGNNWAVGHMEYGDRHGESIVESVRHTVEGCDSIQAFMMTHSLSGGTGSGLGSRVLGLLDEEFPDVARFSVVVMPSKSVDDVVIAPYNTCFALRELVEHADCILPVDNDALARAVDKASGADRVRGGGATTTHDGLSAAAEASSSARGGGSGGNSDNYSVAKPTSTKLPFDDMNSIAAQMISNLTSGVRFPGQLNLDISDIITNMVPFPRLQFLVSSIAPLSAQQRYAGTNASRAVDAMFSSCLDTDHTLVQCDYQRSTVLCSAFVCRGVDVDVGDVSRCIPRIKERMRRIWWNGDGVKTAVCSQPPFGFARSMLVLQNNCAMGQRIEASMDNFVKLWSARSHFHHFRDYLEPAYFEDTLGILGDVVTQYQALNEAEAPARQPTTLRDLLKQRKAVQE